MIRHEDRLLGLVADIHLGAICDDGWQRALDGISDALGGSAVFVGSDAPTPAGRFMAGHRIDADCAALIGGPLATPQANPFMAAMPRTPVGTAVPTSAMCGDDALLRSRLYDEALRPFGQRHVLGAMLERVERRSTVFAVTRPASSGDYHEGDVDLLGRLLPHLARAVHLRAEFAILRSEAAAAFAALDALERGVLLLDARGRILFANREAERILRLSDGLAAGPDGLRAGDRTAAARLRHLVAQAAAAGNAASGGPGGALPIPRPSGRRPFAATVLPAAFAREAARPLRAAPAVTVFLVDPCRDAAPRADHLRALYGLGQAEAALALRLYAGDTLGAAAAALGVSTNTAKTQLKAVFDKVGVSRQAMLVRRIALDLGGLG